MRESLEEIKREARERERRWQEERKKLLEKIERLEEKIREWERRKEGGEVREREERNEGGGRGVDEDRSVEERVKILERKDKEKEKEQRRKNIVVKGVNLGVGEEKEEIEKILKGAQGRVEKIRKIKTGREEWGDMVVVELESWEEKKRIMERKRELKGSKIWIEEDLSWEERRARWIMRGIAMEEERKGNRVWRGKGRMRINEEWWWWDEEVRGLINGKGEQKMGGGVKRRESVEEKERNRKREEN